MVAEHTAGDPMDEDVKWIKLTRKQICIEMKKKGINVSRNIVKKLLKTHGFVKRKIQRKGATGVFKDRDEQFQNIERIIADFRELQRRRRRARAAERINNT